jgi:hypothetical protein
MIETTYNQSIQQIQDLFQTDAGLNCDAIDSTTSNSDPNANYCRRLRDTKCQLEALEDSYAYVEGLFDICPKASESPKEDNNLVQLLKELSKRAAEKSTSPDPAGLPAISEEAVCDVEGFFIMGDNSNDLHRYFSRSIQALDHLIASYESIQAVSGSDFVGTISLTVNSDNIASGTFGGGIEPFLNIVLGNINRISNLKAFLQFNSDLLEHECDSIKDPPSCIAHGVNDNCCYWNDNACVSNINDNICFTDILQQQQNTPGQNGGYWTGANACAAQHHADDCNNVGDDNDCCDWNVASGTCEPSSAAIANNICKITRKFLMVEKLNGKGCNGIDDNGDSVIDTDFTFNGEPVYSSDANYLVDGKSMNILVNLKFVDCPHHLCSTCFFIF